MACGLRLAVAPQTTRSSESSGHSGEASGCSKSVPVQTWRVRSSPADAADPSRPPDSTWKIRAPRAPRLCLFF
jgi:hypothetical protein